MFLKCSTRKKDGKEHRSWSVVESRRVGRGVVQRHVLYLGEINDSQRAAWQKAIAVFDEQDGQTRQCALFPADRTPPATDTPAVQVQLNQLQLSRPRAWGACWLGDQLWRDLQLDAFFAARLGCSREGTDWEKVLRVLTLYRLLSPGSEWRLHRHWFATTAWPICWARTNASPRTTRFIAASTVCWHTRMHSSPICAGVGAICSARSSTCCSTI